jgi:hypothetical protein
MAKQTEVNASVASAYGQEMKEAIKFKFSFEELDANVPADVEKAKSEFEDSDYVATINAKRRAAARAKQTEKVLSEAGYEKPAKDDPKVIFANLLRQFRNGGMAEEQAKQIALTSTRAMFPDFTA